MSADILKILLRSEGRRRLLTEIAKERVITTSELVKRTGLRRQSVVEYIKEFERAGLVAVKKNQKPWVIVSSEDLEYMLFQLPTSPRHKLIEEYPCDWLSFPGCLFKEGKLDLVFVWGARSLTIAKAHDAVGIPEIVARLVFMALKEGFNEREIRIMSYTDIEAAENISVLRNNLFVIGSGVANLLTAKVFELLRPPIRFEPPMGREIISDLTNTVYSAGDEISRSAGIVALLPNPWNKDKVVILAAGIFRYGTRGAIKAIYHHLTSKIIKNHVIDNVPIRVIRASLNGEFEGFLE